MVGAARLRCFIAMAFGREDTDEIYAKSIAPTLRRSGIIPFRVDKTNRNDGIDDMIIEELQKCDFRR